MGCNSSFCAEEAENDVPETIKNNKKEKQESMDVWKKNKNKHNENSKEKGKNSPNQEKDDNYLKLKSKPKLTDKEKMELFAMKTEENRDALSNVLTEGILTSDGHKLTLQKQQCNGVTLMKGIEEYFSEDLTENEILQLVEDALGDNILDYDGEQIPGTITSKQAKVIAQILYKKLNKKNNDEDEKSENDDIDLKSHPELKGLNIKIGVSELTRDVIKNIMFSGQTIDDCQVDLTYENLTKDNQCLKALSIQILP
jgi:hypothetical protein